MPMPAPTWPASTAQSHPSTYHRLNGIKLNILQAIGVEQPVWSLTVTMLRRSATAKPRMRVKAAEARHLLPVMMQILRHWCPLDSEHDRLRLECCEALSACYACLDAWESGEVMGRRGRQFCLLFNELRRSARGDPYWRQLPKFHLFIHLCESGVNPRTSWNYWDESEIGRAAQVAATCHPGHLSRAVIAKYRAFEC